jgi:hypothetical protein
MTSRARSALFLVASALLAACGSRTQLRESGAAASGSGGSGPTTSSASASSGGGFGGAGGHGDVGGSGGMLGACVIDGPPIGLAGTDGYAVTNPVFVSPVQVDSTTVVAGWKAAQGPMDSPTELRHTSFQAWGPWPADATLGPSYLAEYEGGQAFYAAPSFTDFNIFFGLPSTGSSLVYVTHLIPGSGANGDLQGIAAGSIAPVFLERGTDPNLHLMGMSTSEPAPHLFEIALENDKGDIPMFVGDLGCALDPIVAGAAPFGEDFLVAFSSGTSFADDACNSGGAITTAQRLLIARVAKDGKTQLAQEIKNAGNGGTITAVKVVPRLDGAWVAWTATQSSDIQIMRIDPSGKLAGGPFLVPFFGDATSISATSLGDRLALARAVKAFDAPSLIWINVISSGGNVDAELSINLGPPPTGRTAILGSPSNKELLLGWSEEGPLGPALRLARVACSLP